MAGEWSRNNISVYVDLETDLTDSFSLGAAVRYEDYEDFGGTTNGKLAARLRVSDSVSLRGTIQTGFRAPTPGQSNVSNVSTVYSAAVRDLVETGLTPPTDPVAMFYGGLPLGPEESTNYTFGINWTSDFGLAVTLDGFVIQVDDRLAPSSEFELTQSDVDELDRQGVAGVTEGSTLTYYTNSWETETMGVELVGLLERRAGHPRRRHGFHPGGELYRNRGGRVRPGHPGRAARLQYREPAAEGAVRANRQPLLQQLAIHGSNQLLGGLESPGFGRPDARQLRRQCAIRP